MTTSAMNIAAACLTVLAATAVPANVATASTTATGPARAAGNGHGWAGHGWIGHGWIGHGWIGTWAAAPHQPIPGWQAPNWSLDGFAGRSVRQVVRVSTGGTRVRIRLSNRYGDAPLRLTGATVAKAGEGAAILPGTLRGLTFGRSASLTIPAGGEAASDSASLPIRPLEKLTVTLFFAAPTGPATFHERGLTTTYRATGDRLFDHDGRAFAGETSHSWYFLSGVDVASRPGRAEGAVVTFGSSVTDGFGTTPGADDRYPDELAERLRAAGRPLGVLNAGISGNMLLTDYPCSGGDSGLTRFHHDVLDQPGVRAVIVLQGTNDIGLAGRDIGCASPPEVTVAQLVDGHRTLIRAARARGIKVIGATLTPVKGHPWYYSEHNEELRDGLNHWILRGGEYEAAVDLDRVLADPTDPDALRPEYDSGDHLHPNDAGAKAIADAIDLGGEGERRDHERRAAWTSPDRPRLCVVPVPDPA